jgi:hypothetical protein
MLLFEGVAIVAAALLLIGLVWQGTDFFAGWHGQRVPLVITAAAVAWTGVAAIFATNRLLTWPALIWVASGSVVFVATLLVARFYVLPLVFAGIFCAAFNAGLAILQRLRIYNPFVFPDRIPIRERTTALLGNPDDAATYLLFALVASASLMFVLRGVRFWIAALTTVIIACGLVVTETLSALLAAAAAGIVLLMVTTRRSMAAAAVVIAVLVAFVASPPLRSRVTKVYQLLTSGQYFEASSFRLASFISCIRMFRDHPLLGVGPGCFGFWYMPYKQAINLDYPEMRTLGDNFGNAHSDHLQTLATTGLPGYAIFIAAIAVLAVRGARRVQGEPMARFGQIAAAATAAAFFVVALAQFPLELAGAVSMLLHVAAISCAWTAR